MSKPISEYARNIQDTNLQVSRALTAADGNVTSSDIILGTAGFPQVEGLEMCVRLPELAAAELASADTLTIELQNGTAATPTTTIATEVITGTGSAIPAQTIRFGIPRDAGVYFNVKFTTAGTTGDMSDKTAYVGPLF